MDGAQRRWFPALGGGATLLAVGALVALLLRAPDPPPFTEGPPFRTSPGRTYVLSGADGTEVRGVVRVLAALGRRAVVVGDVDPGATGDALIWVPASANPDGDVLERLELALRRGARVVMAGPRGLASRIGMEFGRPVRLDGERYRAAPDLEVRWATSEKTPEVVNVRGDSIVARSPDGEHITAMSGRVAKGRFLWLATGTGRDGIERFPMVPLLLRDILGIEPGASRPGISLYVDPGALPRADPEALADQWQATGVRRIYLAGWEFGFDAGNADYDGYITAAHARGIAVYAWLAPPMVNERMWREQPQCREKTAVGRDAVGDWRRLIALEDPACLALALAEYRTLLDAHPWDGINIAELYFEGPGFGVDRPDIFTPMSDWVRNAFRAEHGFDPKALFDPGKAHARTTNPTGLRRFLAYREDLVIDLHRRLIDGLRGDREVVVTVIDDHLHPQVAANVGSDVGRMLELGRQMGVSIEIEDPFTSWNDGPGRYDTLRRVQGPDVAFDLNVVRRKGAAPTTTPAGSELLTWIAAGGSSKGTISLFAEGSIYHLDRAWLGGALAGPRVEVVESRPGTLTVDAPFSVWVRGPHTATSATVDGAPWPVVDGGRALVPAGHHDVAFAPLGGPAPLPMSCSCELTGARFDGSTVVAAVRADGRAWLSVPRSGGAVLVDGRRMSMATHAGRAFTPLPPGDHTVTFLPPG